MWGETWKWRGAMCRCVRFCLVASRKPFSRCQGNFVVNIAGIWTTLWCAFQCHRRTCRCFGSLYCDKRGNIQGEDVGKIHDLSLSTSNWPASMTWLCWTGNPSQHPNGSHSCTVGSPTEHGRQLRGRRWRCWWRSGDQICGWESHSCHGSMLLPQRSQASLTADERRLGVQEYQDCEPSLDGCHWQRCTAASTDIHEVPGRGSCIGDCSWRLWHCYWPWCLWHVQWNRRIRPLVTLPPVEDVLESTAIADCLCTSCFFSGPSRMDPSVATASAREEHKRCESAESPVSACAAVREEESAGSATFLPPDAYPKTTHTENDWELISACEDLNWNHDRSNAKLKNAHRHYRCILNCTNGDG